MASAGIDNHQRIALLGEVVGQRAYHRIIILEVDMHQSARRRSHLIHQTAGLAKELVLGILSNLRTELEINAPVVV